MCWIGIPARHEGSRGVTPTEGNGAEDIARLQSTGGNRLREGDRNARSRGVPVAVEVDEDLLHWEVDRLRNMLNDAQVRLMWDHQIYLWNGKPRALNRRRRNGRHGARGIDIGLRPIHLDQRIGVVARAARDPERKRARRIGRELKAQRSWSCRNVLVVVQVECVEHDRARAITKEDTGRTITPINNARE